MSRSMAALLCFCTASPALATEPAKKPLDPNVSRLGAVFAGGVLDLMTQPKRDVTASFAALVSAPLGYPKEKRAAEFTVLRVSLPRQVRELNGKLASDGPMMVSLCAWPEGDSKSKLEAILQGRERVWSLTFSADTNVFGVPASASRPPNFFFTGLEALKVTAAERVAAAQGTCTRVNRDAAGEVSFEGEAAPVKFEATLPTPLPSGSDHLLDFADDPDGAVAGIMPVETFANLHRELPQPRAAGVLSLALTAEALDAMGRLTLVASSAPGAVLFIEGLEKIIIIGFRNGYFTTPQFVTPATALSGPWSKSTWSLVEPRMPAEVLLDMTPESAKCLDALPKVPAGDLATTIQRCFDLSLADAGASFRVRRERWLEAVRAHEMATSARVEEFCADQAALAALPFFQRKPAGKKARDAGALLTTVLGWEKRTDAKEFPGTLKLPPDLDQRQAVAGFMELSDKDLAAAASTDLSFFAKLEDFERWDLAGAHGPLDQATTLNAAEAPLPIFQRLTLAARLHLRRGAKNGKLVQAAKDVRHAARLAFSTENLIGQSVAINLLSFEWRAWDWAQKHKLKTPGWAPIDEPTIERARRVVRTAPAFFSPMAEEATFARAAACDQVTSCSAITEVVAVTAGLETLLREPWRARYAGLLATVSADGRCSFALAKHWSSKPMIDVTEARRSRNQEVIAGGMMSRAASGFHLPALTRFYPR